MNQQFNKNEKQNKYVRKDISNFTANRSPNRSPKSMFKYDFSSSNQNSNQNSLNSSIDTAGAFQLAVVLTGSNNRLNNRTSTEFKSIIIDEDNQFEDNLKAIKQQAIAPKQMNKSENKTQRSLRLAFFLSLSYSANIGGTGTLTASNPNLILQAFMEK